MKPSRWYCPYCWRRKRGKRMRCKCSQRGAWVRVWRDK
jgi:hypothetical protein